MALDKEKRVKFLKEYLDSLLDGKSIKTWEQWGQKYGENYHRLIKWYRNYLKIYEPQGLWCKGRPIEDYNPDVELEENSQERESDRVDFGTIKDSKLYKEFLIWRQQQKDQQEFTPGMHVTAGCIHQPFHNEKMWESFLKFLDDYSNQIAGLHFMGDILDMNSLSSHDRGRKPIEGVTLSWEYDQANKEFDKIDQILDGKNVERNFVYGNHEDRYLRHMAQIDNSKYGEALISPEKALRLAERGYNVQTNWKEGTVYLGRYLEVIHGNSTTVHSAKKHVDDFKVSMLFYHTHRIQSHITGNVGGFNAGWMGDADSEAFNYATRAMKYTWNNGFAVVHVDEEGYYYIQQVIWYNGKFYYGNKKYD